MNIDTRAWLEKYCEVRVATQSEVRIKTCPECGADKYKLYVNVSKNLWNCFKCGFGVGESDICILLAGVSGRKVHDVRAEVSDSVTSVSGNVLEALEAIYLNDLYKDADREVDKICSRIALPGTDDKKSIIYQSASKYAQSRGLSQQDIEVYGLRGSSKLRGKSGPFLVFPIIYGEVPVGFQGRRLNNNEPRFVACDDVSNWIYPVSKLNIERYKQEKSAILVEGIFDAISFWKLNIPAACTFGKKISNRQITLLHKLGIQKITMFWDLDAQREVEDSIKRLSKSFNVHVADLSVFDKYDHKVDPGSALQDEDVYYDLRKALDNAINVNSDEFFTWKLKRRL